MRFQLDAETARWFQHGLLRPAAVAAGLDPAVADKLPEVWDPGERVLDLSKVLDDREFLIGLVRALGHLVRTGEEVYAPLHRLAERIVDAAGSSIVDRLAALYEPPPPVEIKTARESVMEMARRRQKERWGVGESVAGSEALG